MACIHFSLPQAASSAKNAATTPFLPDGLPMIVRSATSRRPKQTAFSPRVKVWLEIEGRYAFGFGVSEILQAVDRAGSIKQAAADLGKSYRYVWGRIKKAEQALRRCLVETQVGGQGAQRSFLTPEARRLTSAFLALRSSTAEFIRQEFTRHFA
jgi:molybdate transport system regulatory protein